MPLSTLNSSQSAPSLDAQSLKETLEETIGPELAGALEAKGFERLTPVQEAVLAPELQGKDLRISSQTGSGKTVAIGLAIRDDVRAESDEAEAEPEGDEASGNVKGRDQRARPRALVVTPTRELAKQVEEELAWLYGPLGARVTSVTGGGGYRDELRAFRAKPAIIVGTPGRLLDHLKRGAIDPSATTAVVLDEADRMLDLGFREDLEAILGFPPEEHRTHLVSATFPREVKALADQVQKDWVPVEGTPLGTANLDIEHLIHLVHPRERLAAIINLLLENPGGQSLVFARTRADVADITAALTDAGFVISMLSGEMEQAERNRALAAFKRGNVDALVATDVAARGIDVQDVTRVIHAEPPSDADAYTHRSGRTGRAGKKGTSSVLVSERELPRTGALLARARVRWKFAPIPSASTIREARDENMFASLTADEGDAIDPRSLALAERFLGAAEPARAVGRLVSLALRRSGAEPREVSVINPPFQGGARGAGAARRQEYGRFDGGRDDERGPRRGGEREATGEWVAFRISWGQAHGAEARRLVAMMCRRGKIEGRDIGAIRVGRTSSVVEVSGRVAASFERATAKPDPRDPRVQVRRWSDEPTRRDQGDREHGPSKVTRRHTRSEEQGLAERATVDVPEDRPSRAVAKDRESTTRVPKAPESAVRIPKERPSVAKAPESARIPEDRPSVPKDRASAARVPKDRPSVPKDRESTARVPKDRPSVPKDRESAARVPKDRPSVPKDRESTARIPKDRPSVPKDRESTARVPKDRPSVPKDRESTARVPKDRPSVPKGRESTARAAKQLDPEAKPRTARAEKPTPSALGKVLRREAGGQPAADGARPAKKSPPTWQRDGGRSSAGDDRSAKKSGTRDSTWQRGDGRPTPGGDRPTKKSGPPWQRGDGRPTAGGPAKKSGQPWRRESGGHGPPKRRGPAR